MADNATGNCEKSLQHLPFTLQQKRDIVMALRPAYPVTALCEVLDCARSSLYYQSQRSEEADLKQAIERLATRWVTYGYRRITTMLQREGWQVNHKRVRRLMGEMGLLQTRKRRTVRTTNSQHNFARYPNRVQSLDLTNPDQVWVADITYVQLGRGYVYLAIIMDVFTRAIRGWQLSRNLDAQSLTDPFCSEEGVENTLSTHSSFRSRLAICLLGLCQSTA